MHLAPSRTLAALIVVPSMPTPSTHASQDNGSTATLLGSCVPQHRYAADAKLTNLTTYANPPP